jgi:hypothetical protein
VAFANPQLRHLRVNATTPAKETSDQNLTG